MNEVQRRELWWGGVRITRPFTGSTFTGSTFNVHRSTTVLQPPLVLAAWRLTPDQTGLLPFLISYPCPQTVHFLAKGPNGFATRNRLLLDFRDTKSMETDCPNTRLPNCFAFECSHITAISARSRPLPLWPVSVNDDPHHLSPLQSHRVR